MYLFIFYLFFLVSFLTHCTLRLSFSRSFHVLLHFTKIMWTCLRCSVNRIERGVARVGKVLQQILNVIRFRVVLRTVTQLLANTAYRIRHNHSSFPHSNTHMCTPSHITFSHTYVYIHIYRSTFLVIPLIRNPRSSIRSTVSILYLVSQSPLTLLAFIASATVNCRWQIANCIARFLVITMVL